MAPNVPAADSKDQHRDDGPVVKNGANTSSSVYRNTLTSEVSFRGMAFFKRIQRVLGLASGQ